MVISIFNFSYLYSKLFLSDVVKAQIDNSRSSGESAMHIAATFGYTGIFNALLTAGSDTHKQNDKMETPLFVAAFNGRTEIVEILSKRFKKINALSAEFPLNLILFLELKF